MSLSEHFMICVKCGSYSHLKCTDKLDNCGLCKNDFNNFLTTKYNLHTHPYANGNTSVTTSLGEESTASIFDAKIETIQVPSKN